MFHSHSYLLFGFLYFIGVLAQQGEVVDLTAINIKDYLSKSPILIEFYAPWCQHCRHFEQHYAKVAQRLHEYNIVVAKVDTSDNAAISARFNIAAIPSIFLIKDNKVWKYNGPLMTENVISFATKGYLKEEPLPLWSSPMGPLGLAKGFLINSGVEFVQILPVLSKALGIPEWGGFMVITGGIATFILFVTFIGVYLSVTHSKID